MLFFIFSDTATVVQLSKDFGDITTLIQNSCWSILLSIMSILIGEIHQVAASKNDFLSLRGKSLLAFFSLTAVLIRLSAILLFFEPSLGLMNLLMHWKMGQKEADSGVIFDVIGGEEIEFKNVWTSTPNYTDYTIYSLKTYYVTFIIFAVIHLIFVYAVKMILSEGFHKAGNHFEKIYHVLTQLYIPTNFKDWDMCEVGRKFFTILKAMSCNGASNH